jgi:hypothetical protein
MKYIALGCAVIAVAVLGAVFATTAFATPPFSTNESWSSCTQSLCIDAPPQGPQGFDGSGGWGWDSSANAPVTSLSVRTPAALTVTVLQPASVPACGQGGSITLTYSSRRGNTGSNPFDRGGVETFSV